MDDGQGSNGVLEGKDRVAKATQEKQHLQDAVDVARIAQISQAAQCRRILCRC